MYDGMRSETGFKFYELAAVITEEGGTPHTLLSNLTIADDILLVGSSAAQFATASNEEEEDPVQPPEKRCPTQHQHSDDPGDDHTNHASGFTFNEPMETVFQRHTGRIWATFTYATDKSLRAKTSSGSSTPR